MTEVCRTTSGSDLLRRRSCGKGSEEKRHQASRIGLGLSFDLSECFFTILGMIGEGAAEGVRRM